MEIVELKEGEVDILFSFELLETCRYLPLLRQNGRIVVSDWKRSVRFLEQRPAILPVPLP